MKTSIEHSAGGYVLNEKNHVLIIMGTDQNDKEYIHIPKGHIEKNETEIDAAHREIKEETGYTNLKYITKIGDIKYEFDDIFRKLHVIKTVSYYLFKTTNKTKKIKPSLDSPEMKRNYESKFIDLAKAREILTYEENKKHIEKIIKIIKQGG